MRIEELHLKNFRCFKELDIQFPKSNLAMFIGLNGSGKTAILDVIAIILDKCPANGLVDRTVHEYRNLSYKYNLDDIAIGSSSTKNEILITYGNKTRLWKEHFYTDNEQHDEAENNFRIDNISNDKYICLYYTTSKKEIYAIYETWSEYTDFEDFDQWFEEMENFENALKLEHKDFGVTYVRLDVVRKAITTFFDCVTGFKFSNLKIKRTLNDNQIIASYGYKYKDDIEKHSSCLSIQFDNKEFKLSQLSEGQRLLLHLVGDIAFRLTKDRLKRIEKNGGYYHDNNITVDNALKSNGIVLIDEIELHLHPQWQREVLPALQKTFPNIQFIVTTHSPQVLSNVRKEEIFILEDGALVKNTPHTLGRDSNSILYELFGVEEHPKIYRDKINAFYDALEEEKISDAKNILAELTELFGEQDTEIVKANLHLSFATEE